MITTLSKPRFRRFAFAALCAGCFVLTFKFSDVAIECARAGFTLCLKTIIPSLFPFMIISELVINSGVGEVFGRVLKKPARALFGISGKSSCAVILGALCGFPVGAKIAISLSEQGDISKEETERLISFCNNPSPAFLLNTVGITLYNSKQIGLMLYVITIFSSCVVGVVWNFIYGKYLDFRAENNIRRNKGIMYGFTSAVSNSTQNILTICSYIIFFSSLVGCIEYCLSPLNLPMSVNSIIYGVIELSGGINLSSQLGVNATGLMISAFVVGWSGFSVHFQLISICRHQKLNFKGYFISKLIQGSINAVVIYIVYCTNPSWFAISEIENALPSLQRMYPVWQNVSVLLFSLAILIYLCNAIHKATKHVIY